MTGVMEFNSPFSMRHHSKLSLAENNLLGCFGSRVIKAQMIEAEEEKKATYKTIVHSNTIVLIIFKMISRFN